MKYTRAPFSVLVGLAACLAVMPLAAPAQNVDDVVSVGLLSGWREANGPHMAGVRIQLAPGWKTYWRAPGEAGIPPTLDVEGSTNLRDIQIVFPSPLVFEAYGLRSIGYKREVILGLEATPLDPSKPIGLNAVMEFGVCEQICMPMSVQLTADLGLGGRRDPALVAALNDQPRRVSAQPKCALTPISDGMTLQATLPQGTGASPNAVAVVEMPGHALWVSDASLQGQGGRMVATADLVPTGGQAFTMDRSKLRITVLDESGRAVEMTGCAQ